MNSLRLINMLKLLTYANERKNQGDGAAHNASSGWHVTDRKLWLHPRYPVKPKNMTLAFIELLHSQCDLAH